MRKLTTNAVAMLLALVGCMGVAIGPLPLSITL